MAAKKEAHEFVLVEDHSAIVSDISKSSSDLKEGIDRAIEIAELHNQKHGLVTDAISTAKQIQADIRAFRRNLPLKALPRKRRRRPSARKPETQLEEREFLAKSRKAIEHLQRNIFEIKSELKRIK